MLAAGSSECNSVQVFASTFKFVPADHPERPYEPAACQRTGRAGAAFTPAPQCRAPTRPAPVLRPCSRATPICTWNILPITAVVLSAADRSQPSAPDRPVGLDIESWGGRDSSRMEHPDRVGAGRYRIGDAEGIASRPCSELISPSETLTNSDTISSRKRPLPRSARPRHPFPRRIGSWCRPKVLGGD